jgi:hypothetical protein
MRHLLVLMFLSLMAIPAAAKEEAPDLLGQTFAWWQAQTRRCVCRLRHD